MFISPAVAGNQVYVGSCAGTFYALDKTTGEVAWSYDTSQDVRGAQFHGDVLTTDELVIVGSDARPTGFLYAFERAGGQVRWKIPVAFGVAAQVLRHGDTVLGVAMGGQVMATDLATGAIRWLASGPAEVRGARTEDPALIGDRLIVGWRPGVVQALDANTGETLWQRDLGTTLGTSVAVHRGEALVGGFDGTLFRLDPETGEILGRLDSTTRGTPGGVLFGDLIEAGDCLLALEAGGGLDDRTGASGPYNLHCLRPGDGVAAWTLTSDAQWSTPRPLVHDNQVIVGTEGALLAADLETGERLWQVTTDGLPRGLGAGDDTLYVGHYSGRVTALEWEGAAGPRPPCASAARRTTCNPRPAPESWSAWAR